MKRFDDLELVALLDDLESDRAERKESLKGDTPKKARQAICAFANDLPNHDQPGVLFIGAQDDGSPCGLTITDELLRSLADMKTDGNILPMPVMTVEKRILKGAAMAVVTVLPSDIRPQPCSNCSTMPSFIEPTKGPTHRSASIGSTTESRSSVPEALTGT